MKGFGIEIKNNLLDPKHIEHMGIAVWLYMWLIDKMTSVDEDGVGKILGGKSIKYEDMGEELGISTRTYERWIVILRDNGYIFTERTPYGLVITVKKAYKRFGRSTKSDMPKMAYHKQKMAHLNDKSGRCTITDTVDNNSIHSKEENIEIGELIKAFTIFNPSADQFYKRKAERTACENLIKTYGYDRTKVVIEKTLPRTNNENFFPTISKPTQLFEKWSSLESAIIRYKNKGLDKQRPVFI